MAKFNSTDFKKTLGLLKNADPEIYERLLRQLDQHVFEVTVAVTEASSDQILQAQGRAQEARKIMEFFSEALEVNSPTP